MTSRLTLETTLLLSVLFSASVAEATCYSSLCQISAKIWPNVVAACFSHQTVLSNAKLAQGAGQLRGINAN